MKNSNKKPETPAKWYGDSERLAAVGSVVLFAIFAFIMLVTCYSTYITKIEGLTLFLGTSTFFDTCMAVPGGVVTWLSAWLIQFFHHPGIGALVIVLVLAAIQVVTIKAFRLPARLAPLSVIVPVFVLLAFTNLGYLVFTLKPNGFAMSLPVGILLSLLLYWAFSLLKGWPLRTLAVAAVTMLYPLLGFYALFAAILCALSLILAPRETRFRLQFVLFAVALLFVGFVPKLWYDFAGGELMPSQIYISGLPRFFSHESGIKVIFSLALISVAFGAFMSPLLVRGKTLLKSNRVPMVVWLVAVCGFAVGRYADRDFNTTLELDKALWDQDWQRAAHIAKNMQGPTTRVNTALAYVALMRTGEAPDCMFRIGYGWEPYATTRGGSAFNDAAAYLLSYHLGLPNYAYRWGIEYSIGQIMSPERLKILAKSALLNRDYSLAKTYLDILYNMPNHREWAAKYLRYQSHPMEIPSDPEFAMILPLMCHPNSFVNDGGAVEGYVWPLLANSGEGTPQFIDLSMQAALICRDLDAFVSKLPFYLTTHQRMPQHYQEAALLWAKLGNHPYPAPVSPEVERRHDAFLSAFRNSSGNEAEKQREIMRNTFGDTYWFYFVFNDDKEVK